MKQLKAEEFFKKISPEVVGKFGKIIFELNSIKVTINTKDSIGHMLQDWIEAWAKQHNIYIRPNPSTQEFPDFYLSELNEESMLEIKSFDLSATYTPTLIHPHNSPSPNKLSITSILLA